MTILVAWLRVALVDMRGGLGRFGVLLACLALGVGTIAIVGSVGASLQAALARDARLVLGGDLEAQLSYRAAEAPERALFDELGTVSEVVEVLARGIAGNGSSFLSVRAVDQNYPLLGAVTVEPVGLSPLPELLAEREGVFGIVAGSLLVDRLGLTLGDTIAVGDGTFALRGVLAGMPDQVTQGISLGIPALVSIEGLATTGILKPGVLGKYRYKVLFDDGIAFEDAAARVTKEFPGAGWEVNSPQDATADLSRVFSVFSRFLIIIGLSSLLVGGVGVSNAVSAYVTDRQRSIAILRSLGATNARIMVHFLVQVMILTALGIVLGLVLGAIITIAALPVIGNLLSISLPPLLDAPALLTASGFGLLIGFAFGFLPLKRAQTLRPALLFRSAGSAIAGGLGWHDLLRPGLWLPLLVAVGLIYGLAALTTGEPVLVAWYAGGALAAFVILQVAAFLVQRLLRLVPPMPNANLRNAIKSLYRPGAPAPTVILSLGAGLALLLLIALVDNNLRHQLDGEVMLDAPSFIFMDLFEDEAVELAGYAETEPRLESFQAIVMLRGAIVSINGVPAAEIDPPTDAASRAFEGEIPLSFSGPLPPQSEIVAGEWWPEDYTGPPLVSVFSEMQTPLGLELGDQIEFRIFGEPVVATIANFRDFPWRGGAINFSFVLTPNAFEAFPVSYLGLMKSVPGAEREMQAVLIEKFPDLLFLPVSDAIAAIAGLVGSVTNAIAIVGGLALISGLFVLAGAMAAGRRQREADATVMKVLGATRGDVIRAYLIEYGVLGVLSALLAVGLGTAGAWAFVTYVLEIAFVANAGLILLVVVGAVALTIAIGTATTWSALSVRPAQQLRAE